MQNGAAAYGGAPGSAQGPYGGSTGANGYGGPTGANGYGAAYGGPTGAAYGGPTGAAYGGAMNGAAPGPRASAPIKLKDCSTPELLQHLPTIQKLLGRLMQCVPEGASAINPVILVRPYCSWPLEAVLFPAVGSVLAVCVRRVVGPCSAQHRGSQQAESSWSFRLLVGSVVAL
jgi:hypothetical protein